MCSGWLWTVSLLLLTNILTTQNAIGQRNNEIAYGTEDFNIYEDRNHDLTQSCVVQNRTYVHGETFLLDCRTQCVCQNGRYGCSSLCPQERVRPRCRHPRLVELPDHCCRQWQCDPPPPPTPENQTHNCVAGVSPWSLCLAACGVGLSHRQSNLNARCETTTDTRLCQHRACDGTLFAGATFHKHHIRKGHECKATERVVRPVHFRFGPCRSRKRFRPKYCGACSLPGMCCEPQLSTTVRVDFICEGYDDPEHQVLAEMVDIGENLWSLDTEHHHHGKRFMSVDVEWVLKCSCGGCQSTPTAAPGVLHRVHRTLSP